MANVQKYTRNDVGGGSLTRHYERAKDGEGNYHQWGNQDIDLTRSHMNYNLAPERGDGQIAFIGERISEVKCHKRDDVNIMCSWIITVPKGLEENEYDKFFREAYDFLCKKYGEINVVSAYVHMDETTPHMHFAFVPVVVDKKKGHEKVSAKEALGWSEKGLHKFHGELDAYMTDVFGRDIGVLNEATKDGNKEIWELKRETSINEAKMELEAIKRPIEGRIAHEKRINRLEDGVVEKKIPFTKNTKVVITADNMTAEEARTVLNAARDRDKMRVRMDSAIKERDNAVTAKNEAIHDKQRAEIRLYGVEQKEATADKKQRAADELYRQQTNLNQIHKQTINEIENYKGKLKEKDNDIILLTNQNAHLTAQIEKQDEKYAEQVESLQEGLQGAYTSLANIVKAVKTLKDDGNLTQGQVKTIDGLEKYGVKWATDDGFEDIAEDIKNNKGISKSIKNIIEPPVQVKKRSYGMDL